MRAGFRAPDQALLFLVLGASAVIGQLVVLPGMMKVSTEKYVLLVGLACFLIQVGNRWCMTTTMMTMTMMTLILLRK